MTISKAIKAARLVQLEAALTKDDWEYISYATQVRFNNARPGPGEGRPSPEFLDQEKRIMSFLLARTMIFLAE